MGLPSAAMLSEADAIQTYPLGFLYKLAGREAAVAAASDGVNVQVKYGQCF